MGAAVPIAPTRRRGDRAQHPYGVPARGGLVLDDPRPAGARFWPTAALRPGLARPLGRALDRARRAEARVAGGRFRGRSPWPPPAPGSRGPAGPPDRPPGALRPPPRPLALA